MPFASREAAASSPYCTGDEARRLRVCLSAAPRAFAAAREAAAWRAGATRGRSRACCASRSATSRKISIHCSPGRRRRSSSTVSCSNRCSLPIGEATPCRCSRRPCRRRRTAASARDGLTIRYPLRRNARWSDGVPVTARDVIWSWQRDHESQQRRRLASRLRRRPFDRCARRAYRRRAPESGAFAPFVNTFFAESDQPYDVVPAHVLARYPDINHVPFDARPR